MIIYHTYTLPVDTVHHGGPAEQPRQRVEYLAGVCVVAPPIITSKAFVNSSYRFYQYTKVMCGYIRHGLAGE